MNIRNVLCGVVMAALAFTHASGGGAQGFAGPLTGKKRLNPITLSSGKPLAKVSYELQSGKYYSLDIVADGSAELAIAGHRGFTARAVHHQVNAAPASGNGAGIALVSRHES